MDKLEEIKNLELMGGILKHMYAMIISSSKFHKAWILKKLPLSFVLESQCMIHWDIGASLKDIKELLELLVSEVSVQLELNLPRD